MNLLKTAWACGWVVCEKKPRLGMSYWSQIISNPQLYSKTALNFLPHCYLILSHYLFLLPPVHFIHFLSPSSSLSPTYRIRVSRVYFVIDWLPNRFYRMYTPGSIKPFFLDGSSTSVLYSSPIFLPPLVLETFLNEPSRRLLPSFAVFGTGFFIDTNYSFYSIRGN